jgi:hypothetical protein
MTNTFQVWCLCAAIFAYIVRLQNYSSTALKHFSGWSQFAQFTIAVGNLDPKKVKYSGKNQLAVFHHRAKQPIRS